MAKTKQIKIKLVRSLIGTPEAQRIRSKQERSNR